MSFVPAATGGYAAPQTQPGFPGLVPIPEGTPMPLDMGMGQPPNPYMPPMEGSSPIIDAEFQVMVAEEEASIAPPPPPWYVPLPKPTADEICAEAHEQKQMHDLRILRQAWLQLRLGMEITSIFGSDQLWVQLKEIEPQPSPILRIINDAIINFVATQTVQHSSLAHGLVNREERAAIEDHLDDSHRDWRDSHYREGQGSLLRTLTADALSGMVAVYHAPDPGNVRSGQRRYRVDPKCVYPIFGRDGLDCLYVIYEANYHEVMRDYGDGPDGPVTESIKKIANMGKGRGAKRAKLAEGRTDHELVAYYDRERAIVTWRGETIKEWEHKLWVVPWHIGVPNWRQQTGTKSAGGFAYGGDRSGPLISVDGISTPYGGGMNTSGTRELDIMRMYEPFLMPWVPVVDKLERVQTRLNYGVDRSLDNPLVWKRAASNSEDGTPEIQNYRRGVTEIEEDEEIDVLPMNPLGDSFAPWMELFKVELQAAIPVPILQGQSIGTQASGNAIDVLTELGYAHFAPVPEFIQMFLGAVDHRDLEYIRDWNKTYRDGNGQVGLPVPSRYQSHYGADPIRLTAEMLERAGCYVEVTLRRFSLSGAAAHATAAAIMDAQMGLGTRRFWGQTLGLPNAHRLEDDRRTQNMEDAPGYIEALQIEYLKDEMDRAVALEDEKSLLRIQTRAKRVAWKQTAHDMQIAKMIGMMPPQPEPMPGELPAGTGSGQPGTNPMPYLSAPQVARETGTEGGAPSAQTQLPLPGAG